MPDSTRFTAPTTSFVAPLAAFGRADLSLAGGKGANLGELLRTGFDVPPGFIITTAAYDLLLQNDGLQTKLNGLLASLGTDSSNPDLVTHVSQEIRQKIERTPFPAALRQPVTDAYRKLGLGAVAVRSSATAEDLPGAAFAGQQETFLNIVDEPALLEAVRACWASLWSERAILYRIRRDVEQASVRLAVVIQQMVPAEVAGVMFTANPVSGARNELVIDASPGLGEAVVSGVVTPDHFVIDKSRGRVKEQRIGRREVIIRAKAGGGTEQITPSDQPVTTTLAAAEIRQLARLGVAIERHYAAPQDIEWAWVRDGKKTGHFMILQARPMTALPEPVKISGPMRQVLPMLAEMWPTRPYPLDMTTFTGALERAIGNFLTVMIGKSAPDPDQSFLEEDGVIVRFQPPEVRPAPGMLITPWLTFWRTRRYDPGNWQADPLLAEVLRQGRELNERDVVSRSWAQNIESMHEALALIPRVMLLRERYLPPAVLGLGSLWLLLALARRSDRLGTLLAGVETKTTETNRALENLAGQIRSDPFLCDLFAHNPLHEILPALRKSSAGQAFLEQFTAFLLEYGHRETTLTISQGAWKDQPEIVLGILKVQATAPPQAADSYLAWKRTRDELLAHSILGTWPLRPAFLKALTGARALLQIREDTHFYATLAQPPARHVALELGQRLQRAGAFSHPEDVLHLRLDELETLGQPWPPAAESLVRIRALVAQRQAKRDSLADTPMIDPRLLATAPQPQAGADVLLSGAAGSPGLASGPVCIVHDSSEFGKLRPGDVLVAPLTNPAWTPLFQHAAAVVVDAGGAASHAAIVAREYSVPAVMGTVYGTQQLKDGQLVRVDGSRGLVLKGEERE